MKTGSGYCRALEFELGQDQWSYPLKKEIKIKIKIKCDAHQYPIIIS